MVMAVAVVVVALSPSSPCRSCSGCLWSSAGKFFTCLQKLVILNIMGFGGNGVEVVAVAVIYIRVYFPFLTEEQSRGCGKGLQKKNLAYCNAFKSFCRIFFVSFALDLLNVNSIVILMLMSRPSFQHRLQDDFVFVC